MPSLIQIDTSNAQKELERVKGLLHAVPKGLEKATLRALQKTAKGMRTDGTKIVREDFSVRAKDVRKKFVIKKNYHRSSSMDFGITVVAKDFRSNPLYDFSPIERSAGSGKVLIGEEWKTVPLNKVSVKVKKAGGRKAVKGAFVATMNSGHTGIFARTDKDRTPIKELFTTSPLHALTEDENVRKMEEKTQERLDKNFEHEADFVLREAGLR
ncbi:phage tail protein [Maridesulfovibrio sp.]|uniref:phage tail protein n=1 Tax=Maridesulfovibrio sp. TaxID=2795000 RepID=UPI003AFFBA00